jgi:hypothetical protein
VCTEGLLRHTLMFKNSNNCFFFSFVSPYFKWCVVVGFKGVQISFSSFSLMSETNVLHDLSMQ